MKKFIAAFCFMVLLPISSHATGYYVGADALFANARHKAKSSSESGQPVNESIKNDDNVNLGFNGGVRFDLLNLLIMGELFYDDLNTSAKSFDISSSQSYDQDRTELKNRYGAKVNVGFAILPKVTPFVSYGFANVSYKTVALAGSDSVSKSEMAPIYGVGLIVDLPFDISAKASYDYQAFDMRYANDDAKIRTHLGVAKLGVIFNF